MDATQPLPKFWSSLGGTSCTSACGSAKAQSARDFLETKEDTGQGLTLRWGDQMPRVRGDSHVTGTQPVLTGSGQSQRGPVSWCSCNPCTSLAGAVGCLVVGVTGGDRRGSRKVRGLE